MSKVHAFLVKAFTTDKNQGNPAGVILNADNLTDEQMINISAQLGFSESAFVQKSDKADFKVRFFTSTQEVPLCGHATIATFYTLSKTGLVTFNEEDQKSVTQETKSGVLGVTCYKNGRIMMDQNEPFFDAPEKNKKLIAKLLSLSPADLLDYPIQSVSTGVSKLIVPVKSLDRIFAIQPDLEGIKIYSQEKNTRGFYPFTFETKEKDSDFHARMFNPLIGINEDPITGVAAGPLGAYIRKHKILDKSKFVVEQGYVMNKAGKIIVDVSENIKVGGNAVIFDERELKI
jgi:PhzF family phenazine biosynthesis protein